MIPLMEYPIKLVVNQKDPLCENKQLHPSDLMREPGISYTEGSAMDREIQRFFKEQGITIGTTTVYRNLEKMVEQGLVAKYNVDGTSSACFEYIGDHGEEHENCYHCKCEKCGKLIHLQCNEIESLKQHMQQHHDFQMDPHRTVFYGICGECSKKE